MKIEWIDFRETWLREDRDGKYAFGGRIQFEISGTHCNAGITIESTVQVEKDTPLEAARGMAIAHAHKLLELAADVPPKVIGEKVLEHQSERFAPPPAPTGIEGGTL